MTCTHATTHSQTLEGKKTGDDCEQTLEYKYKIKEKKKIRSAGDDAFARSLARFKKKTQRRRPPPLSRLLYVLLFTTYMLSKNVRARNLAKKGRKEGSK